MLRIIHEAQLIETPGHTGCAFTDFVLEDEDYIMLAIDLRNYTGPRAKWAEGVDVVYCSAEEVAHVFEPDFTKPKYGMYCWDWAGYCRYINQNCAA